MCRFLNHVVMNVHGVEARLSNICRVAPNTPCQLSVGSDRTMVVDQGPVNTRNLQLWSFSKSLILNKPRNVSSYWINKASIY